MDGEGRDAGHLRNSGSGPAWSPTELAAMWEAEVLAAEAEDAHNNTPTWVPPIKAPLVRAVRATSLHRLFPFTSMNRLCFSSGPAWWDDQGVVAPAHIALAPEGDYVVYGCSPYARSEQDFIAVLATEDPVMAATAVERLLVQWTG